MISKSYQLLNFLNRPHGKFSQWVLGHLAFAGSLVASRDRRLAQWAKTCFERNDFKQGFRTCAWMTRVALPRLHVWEDHFFDFTEGADKQLLDAMDEFLARRQARQPVYVALSDQLYVLAARVHASVKSNNGQRDQIEPVMLSFYAKADELLAEVSERFTDDGAQNNDDREGDFSVDHAKQALEDFAALFPKSEWPWYLVSGTLLGVYRDGGFMAHDYDIDLGVNDGEVDVHAMLDKLDAAPEFVVKKIDHHLEVSRKNSGDYAIQAYRTMYKVIHRDGVNLDIFIHYRDGDVLWHGSVIHRWDNKVYGLTEYDLAGVPVLGPDDPERYLTENYGDWRTPVTDFDCTTGTPNLVIARNFLSVALFLKRLGHFAHHDARQYDKLRATLLRSGIVVEHTDDSGKGRLKIQDFL